MIGSRSLEAPYLPHSMSGSEQPPGYRVEPREKQTGVVQPRPAREQGEAGHSAWVEEGEFGEEPGCRVIPRVLGSSLTGIAILIITTKNDPE